MVVVFLRMYMQVEWALVFKPEWFCFDFFSDYYTLNAAYKQELFSNTEKRLLVLFF